MPSPRLAARRVDGLPRLAWCARLDGDASAVHLVHGAAVEVHGDAFVAGAWNGPFENFGFCDAHTMAGTGGRVMSDTVAFASSSHLYDHVFSLRSAGRLVVGNSLPVVLAVAGDHLDPGFRDYRAAQLDLLRTGFAGSPVRLPTQAGNELLLHAGTDLVVDGSLDVKRVDKEQPPDPVDYDGYHRMLAGTVAALVANATDPTRHSPLRVITTLSSGYDSSVAALLGAAAGTRDAVTSERDGMTDDGADVALALGLHLHRIDGEAWKTIVPCPDVEFAASTGRGRRLGLAALEGPWNDSLVLTGTLGDKVWERRRARLAAGLAEPDPRFIGATSVQEFALRTGLVFAHVPAIGAVHLETIRRITESEAMEPWSVGGRYDRPIARRMLEEAGVPRAAFGWVKHAGITIGPEVALSEASREDFEAFWAERRQSLPVTTRARFWIETRVVRPHLFRFARRAATRMRLRTATRALIRWRRRPDPQQSYEFHWAVARLQQRATEALGADEIG